MQVLSSGPDLENWKFAFSSEMVSEYSFSRNPLLNITLSVLIASSDSDPKLKKKLRIRKCRYSYSPLVSIIVILIVFMKKIASPEGKFVVDRGTSSNVIVSLTPRHYNSDKDCAMHN